MLESRNRIRQQDLEELACEDVFKSFGGKTVLVTGATGLIGSEIVLGLLAASRLNGLKIKVVAFVRDKIKAETVFAEVLNRENLEIVVQDVNLPIEYEGEVDYIVHAAGMTSSKMMIEKPVECAMTAVDGTRNVLEFARTKDVKSVCYLSSIEIYGQNTPDDVSEEDYGVLNPINLRNAYSIGKKLAENLCVAYSKEYGVKSVIARLTQTFGAGISENENRVFAQFAKSAVSGEDVVLHTDGSSVKNYCYLTDAVSGILTLLIRGECGQAYNIANYETEISIKDLAQMIATKYGLKLRFEQDSENRGYADKIVIKLNPKKLEGLGWRAKVGLEEMFERLVESLKWD